MYVMSDIREWIDESGIPLILAAREIILDILIDQSIND